MPFSALLDANVLVPNALRDTLLRIAEADLYRPLWSQDVIAETRRTILRLRPSISPSRLDTMFAQMNDAFADALVTGYEPVIASMTNHEGDRHVLAAAVVGRADVIVTNNVKHFPSSAVEPFHIEAVRPDRFLCLQYDLSPSLVIDLIKEQSADTGHLPGKPKFTVEDLLNQLSKAGAPQFADHVRGHLAASRIRQRSPETPAPHLLRPQSGQGKQGTSG